MKAKEAIKLLKKLKPDEQLIIAWWQKDMFEYENPDDWGWISENVTDEFDWSGTHEDIQLYIDNE